MKNIKYLLIAILFTANYACNDLDEINEDPNNVSEADPRLLLTAIQKDAFEVEGTSPMYASRMLVSADGESTSQYYKWDRAGFSTYLTLGEVTKMIEEAKRAELPEYEALGKFFRAYYFNKLTLTFGDIPFAQALQGETERIFQPTYSTQKEVFVGILKELEEANEILKTNTNIIGGDIIFNGDMIKWRKVINSFRLKILISLSKKAGDMDLNIAASFASIVNNEPIISSVEDSAMLVFEDAEGARYSEFNSSGYGSGMYMASTFVDMLKDRQDPRLFIFCTQTRKGKEDGLAINDFASYAGADPTIPYGEYNDIAAAGLLSKVNLRYSTDPTTEPHAILGYWEMEFVLAEAAVRGWIPAATAKSHYENGVRASFQFYNTYAKGLESYVDAAAATTYLDGADVGFDNAANTADQIALIIEQKYFASFLQDGWRMYFDQLRTGVPNFPYVGTNTPPTRWMYPNEEYVNNADNVNAAVSAQFGSSNDGIRQIPWWLIGGAIIN